MRSNCLLFFLFLITSCDPMNYGFEKNPTFVLSEALKSITTLDTETFLEVTGKEALCIYANDKGILYLKENIQNNSNNVALDVKLIDVKEHKTPTFVGYWSYYHERYLILVIDRQSLKVTVETVIDCEYGSEEKSDEYQGLLPSQYRKKECRAVKLMSKDFKPLPLPTKCENLKVTI